MRLFFALILQCMGATSADIVVSRPLSIEGEVYATSRSVIAVPQVDGAWNLTVAQISENGARVSKGDVVVAFDTSSLIQQLSQRQSELVEQEREAQRLVFELSDSRRNDDILVAEGLAAVAKAQRNTQVPRELVAAMQYEKSLASYEISKQRLQLAIERKRVATRQYEATERLADLKVSQTRAEIERIQSALTQLTVLAPRSGIFLKVDSWTGERFDVGSQVWVGQTLGEIPELANLSVRARLPERDYSRIHTGANVVIVSDDGSKYAGTVRTIGRVVRSGSSAEPIPMIDLEIEVREAKSKLRVGQAVRVVTSTSGVLSGESQ